MTSTLKRPGRSEQLTIADMKLPKNDVNMLKGFYKFGREDEKRLTALAGTAEKYADRLVDAFYEHILDEPESAKFFPDSATVDRAKRAQKKYFEQLTSGDYGKEYFESRLTVGVMHNTIDLPPKWYLGGFANYLDAVAGEIQAAATSPEEAYASFRSFVKLIMLDTATVMESFIICRQNQLEAEKESVRKAEDFNRSILDAAATIAIYAVSPEGIVQTWNSGSEHIFGYRADEIIGQDFRRFYPKEELDKGQVEFELREAAAKGWVAAEGWRVAKGDRKFFGRARFSCLKDSDGKVIGFVKIVQDETEKKRVEDRLFQQRTEIASLIKVLNGVTAQVSSISTQLSSSTAQTVAAISETTATAEEVKQTADQTSQQAKSVSDDAKGVVQVSKQGQEATDQTVNGMVKIREQMDSIAECMVQLSNQSKLIGDIIASVDDLAQQSNLLAVNASIEAAKAGEQGKGFAVVAQEVKNLSQQSKSATAHVRSILNDIVKATTAATMATEQGGRAVEVGHAQASDAGTVIRTLSTSIDRAAQATELIEVSSQQQLIGMKQMVEAMESIKIASEQNLQSANQLEATGREMNELGRKLLDLSEST